MSAWRGDAAAAASPAGGAAPAPGATTTTTVGGPRPEAGAVASARAPLLKLDRKTGQATLLAPSTLLGADGPGAAARQFLDVVDLPRMRGAWCSSIRPG